jgi:hypothetical protein
MQKVITAEIRNHYQKDIEEPFKSFLDDGWHVVSVTSSAARLMEDKAVCWITAILEKQE